MNFSAKFQWQLNWKILVFVGLFLPITILLGFWQLDRADQKEEILAMQDRQQQLPPLTNADWNQDLSNHLRRVNLMGSLDADRYLLLANRTIDAQVGYEVIALAETLDRNNNLVVEFVNRGWVPASLNRAELPEILTPSREQPLSGYYYCPEANTMIKESLEFEDAWPAIIYSMDNTVAQAMELALNRSALPCEIRLDPSPLAFRVQWQVVNQGVQKHIGYAVQWFSMAFALIILALFSNSNLGLFFARKSD